MISTERALGFFIEALAPIIWRSPAKMAAKLEGFAATESGSALDMFKAAELTDDPRLRRLFFRHALDEARHARMFHEAAQQRAGDWGQQALEYCGQTGLEMDHILQKLLDLGLTRADIRDIERLSNSDVLRRMGGMATGVTHFARTDAIAYFEAWADLLEEQLPEDLLMAAK